MGKEQKPSFFQFSLLFGSPCRIFLTPGGRLCSYNVANFRLPSFNPLWALDILNRDFFPKVQADSNNPHQGGDGPDKEPKLEAR